MTGAAWVLLAVFGVLAMADWVAVARGSKPLEYVCKPGALAALVGVAVAIDPTHSDTRAWFVAALALSLVGDVFLMLPADRFVAGLASFLLGHVAYVLGLNLHGGSATALAIAAVPVIVAGAVLATRILRAVLVAGERELIGPLVGYVVVISAMVTSALASGNALAAAGAVLFMTSDSLIAEHRFVRSRPWAPLAIIVTYHLGQAGLTLSLVR